MEGTKLHGHGDTPGGLENCHTVDRGIQGMSASDLKRILQLYPEQPNRRVQKELQMKYDDASWHSGGSFPKDLPASAGATHTGMYVAWALQKGLASKLHTDEMADDLHRLAERSLTPGAFFLSVCDGKFTDEDLSEEGNAFTAVYFDFSDGLYLADYELALAEGLPDIQDALYYVADTWENFD
ncbi:hypothetical protein [Dyella sp. 20L07]|uniref:DUF7832 domain-containing protein n=1 Tax=Dyella sp. 20L07 TaxID=3384240 RepID=UPI003D2CD3A4